MSRFHLASFAGLLVIGFCTVRQAASALEVAVFETDVTPPVGSPLCDGLVPPMTGVNDPLGARGVVLLPDDQRPIVLLAMDWVGIGNEGHDAWRTALAEAADTTVDRVAVHALHQHDAPGCDFLAERLAAEVGLEGELFPVEFARQAIARTAAALRATIDEPQRVTRLTYGQAKVEKVASNRRILGPDGKVQHGRMSSCSDPQIRDFPEGIIDPFAKVVGFWQEDQPLVVLTYYATHPQSYYRTGKVSADFVGLARDERDQALPGTPHIHFNGAGGNVAAGKYNDGSKSNRPQLASRLADGLRRAWQNQEEYAPDRWTVDWATRDIALPPASWLAEDSLRATLEDQQESTLARVRAARDLAWLVRCREGHQITVARLRIGPVDILHLPGELFVEYQLAAQTMRPDAFVCTAAYGDYGMGYIGLSHSYARGGYETGPASRVAPGVETVLIRAIEQLMK